MVVYPDADLKLDALALIRSRWVDNEDHFYEILDSYAGDEMKLIQLIATLADTALATIEGADDAPDAYLDYFVQETLFEDA